MNRLGRCRANRVLREYLWELDPHCHWCERLTELVSKPGGGALPGYAATLDHFGERRYQAIVLACSACNQYRAKLEQQWWKERANNPRRPMLPSIRRLLEESRAWLVAHG